MSESKPFRLTESVKAAGGASKLSPAALDTVLGKLARQHDPNVLVGFDHADDAGVYLIAPDQALVQDDAQGSPRRSSSRSRSTGTDGWLIPGRHAGQHITADRLQQRLKRHGIERSREGRHAALLALAARLPAPIFAERIGIHQSRAAAWARMAGATYADYVAARLDK